MPFNDKRFRINKFQQKQKMKDKQRRGMFYSINNPKGPRSSRKRGKQRPKVTIQGEPQNKKVLSNNIRTVSGSKKIRVVESFDGKENRRNFQNNVVYIEDEDANIQITVIDRQNSLKPKKAKFITTENIEGDKVITEYDSNKRKVAELHIQASNIKPIDTSRSPSQLESLSRDFNRDSKNLENSQLANKYDLATLRTIAKNKYNIIRPSNIKNEKIWLVKKIKSVQS